MGLSCFRAISGWDGLDGMGWDLCVGLFYEHRFAKLISGLIKIYPILQFIHPCMVKEQNCDVVDPCSDLPQGPTALSDVPANFNPL